MRKTPNQSLISKLIMRESDSARIDWPAMLTLTLYIAIVTVLIVGGVYFLLAFWQHGWLPRGIN